MRQLPRSVLSRRLAIAVIGVVVAATSVLDAPIAAASPPAAIEAAAIQSAAKTTKRTVKKTTKKRVVTTKQRATTTTTTTVAPATVPSADPTATTIPLNAATTPTIELANAASTTVAAPTSPPAPTMSFAPCAAGLDCATLSVPLDYARPTGTQISLFVARRKATDTTNRLGVLFVNPGGPGAPAYDLVRSIALVLNPDVLARYDIIGVDPRGTERSTPLRCIDGHSGRLSYGAACGQSDGPALPFMDTITAARDLDAVRAALGEPKMAYVGISYGTHLGAVYQKLFPANVARMVLDSAIVPTRFGTSMLIDKGAAMEIALDAFLDACASGVLTPCAFNDGTDLKRRYADLRISVQGRSNSALRSLDSNVSSLIGYPRNGWPVLGRALQEIATTGRGNFSALPSDDLATDGREKVAPLDSFSDATNAAISCRDGIVPRGAASAEQIVQGFATVAPRFASLGSSFASVTEVCTGWPVEAEPAIAFTPQGVAIAVLANRHDLTTPLSWSQELAAQLGAPLLIREGGGHAALDKSQCVRDSVSHFLLDAVPALSTTACNANVRNG